MSTAGLAEAGEGIAGCAGLPGELCIEAGAVPLALKGATAEGVLWQAAPGRFLLRVPEAAGFLVEAGRKITVERAPQSEPVAVARFLRMTPLAALHYQRGNLVFHAAAAVNASGAILLAGDSGAGKSTLLAALLRRGWRMSGDELAAIKLDEDGQVNVVPAFPEFRIWQDAGENTEAGSGTMDGVGGGWRVVSAASQFSATVQPLRAIYWLAAHNVDRVEQRELEGMEKFRAVGMLAYNSHIADALLDRAAYMRQASAIAQTVPLRRLYRPRGKWTVEELADHIEKDRR